LKPHTQALIFRHRDVVPLAALDQQLLAIARGAGEERLVAVEGTAKVGAAAPPAAEDRTQLTEVEQAPEISLSQCAAQLAMGQ
jgi:hypothetical protein